MKARLLLKPRSSNAVPYGTSTDAAGRFLMDEVDAGSYVLTASRTGYSDQFYPRRGGPKHWALLTLDAGQSLKQLVLKLTPLSLISGRVLDADGDPLANVNVQCARFGYQSGKRRLSAYEETSTNDLGEFRLQLSSAGKCLISATYQSQTEAFALERPAGSPQGALGRYITTYYPSATSPSLATGIEIAAGSQISGINVTLMRARTFHVKGRVVADGVPMSVRQMTVSLILRDPDQFVSAARVDSKGSFQLQGVVSGSYFLEASSIANGRNFRAGRMPIEVSDANIDGVEMTLLPPEEIHGRVIIQREKSAQGDDRPEGIAPVLILHSRNSDSNMSGMFVRPTDDRTFKTEGVPVGFYDFGLAGVDEKLYVKSIHQGDQDVTETGFEVSAGMAAELTVELSANGGTVEGVVKDDEGQPAAAATISLIPGASHRALALLYKTADTDQNGHFRIQGVTPGEYRIYAWEELESGADRDPDFMKPHESAGQAVSINERGHEEIQLKVIPADDTAKKKPE